MPLVEQKINNSYESEPSSSNGSSEDSVENINVTPLPTLLKNAGRSSTINNINYNGVYHFNDVKLRGHYQSTTAKHDGEDQGFSRSFSSSEESDFCGFNISGNKEQLTSGKQTDIISNKKNEPRSLSQSSNSNITDAKLTNQPLSTPPYVLKEISSNEHCNSSEISDQDVRCRKEIKKHSFILSELANRRMSDDSQFSIEINSSASKASADVPEFICENSSNAVDVKISDTTLEPALVIQSNKLSFNGIINTISNSSEDLTQISKKHSDEKNLNIQLVKNDIISKYVNENSPDLFADSDNEPEYNTIGRTETTQSSSQLQQIDAIPWDQGPINPGLVNANERILLKRLQSVLSGVLPPPSVTILQYSIPEMLSLYQKNYDQYSYVDDSVDYEPTLMEQTLVPENDKSSSFLFAPSHCIDVVETLSWPDCLGVIAHGIHYNHSTCSESIEQLCQKYAERNVGAETRSSFTHESPSSCKKRNQRLRMLNKSPGNRLSHLAKRRAIFSSANLLKSAVSSTESSKLGNNQLVIDTRISGKRGNSGKIRTPGRRVSGRKTPGKHESSFAMKATAPTRESSKRALFQSPAKERCNSIIKSELASRVDRSKRVLFSPLHSAKSQTLSPKSVKFQFGSLSQSSLDIHFQMPPAKRRREDVGDDAYEESLSKMQRLGGSCNMENLTPQSLMFAKSQSFCADGLLARSNEFGSNKSLLRASSEAALGSSQKLSLLRRQKILWAVSTSLKKKSIPTHHRNYKQYAAVLAKVTKRFFLEHVDRNSFSTSEVLLKIADKHVFWVLQGKSEDEIYLNERNKMDNIATSLPKLTGYIAPAEYEERQKLMRRSASVMHLSDSSTDSMVDSLSQKSLSKYAVYSQSTEFLGQLSGSSGNAVMVSQTTTSPRANISSVLTNSSSKSNSKGCVLRENVDSEQRQKSGQKAFAFSGKDQKNVSPYTDKTRENSLSKQHNKLLAIGNSSSSNPNALKAKRQISFD